MKKTMHYKHLEFLYNVTHVEKYLNHQGLSKKLRLNSGNVTPQTIQNWLQHFKEYNFNYFHSIIFEKIGLTSVFVVNKKRIPESPFRDAVWKICNPYSLEKSFMARYLVPSAQLNKFKSFALKNQKECYFLKSRFVICPPYHKTMNKENSHAFNQLTREDFKNSLARFKYYLSKIDVINDEGILKKEPFLLPVIIESRKKNISSVQIWHAIKEKLGDKTWDYLTKKKDTSDEIGIKRVQRIIKFLNADLNHLVQQIDIDYSPLLSSTVPFVLIVKYKNKEALSRLIEKMALKSARLIIYPNSNNALIISYVQSCGIKQILRANDEYIKFNGLRYLDEIIEDHAFDYSKCFDPIKREWIKAA